MKKINRKGITIIELIVTIALISIIMLFLYALLSNITFESDNEYIDIVDRTVREDIIRTINDTINEYNESTTNFADKAKNYNIQNKTIQIKKDSSASTASILYTVTITDTTLSFYKGNGTTLIQKWELTNGKFGNLTASSCKKQPATDIAESAKDTSIQLVTCNIKVTTGNINNKEITIAGGRNINNNNVLDDIEFTYGVTPKTSEIYTPTGGT